MRLALERGGEARRHAGIEYLLFWNVAEEDADPEEEVLESSPRSFRSLPR